MENDREAQLSGSENGLTAEIQAVFAIFELQAKLQEHADQIVTDPVLLPNETLLLINMTGPHRMGEVANLLHCLPSSATAVVDGLEQKQLVCRRPDPQDRRATLLHLTEGGVQIRAQILAGLGQAFRLSSGLDAEGAKALLGVLNRSGGED